MRTRLVVLACSFSATLGCEFPSEGARGLEPFAGCDGNCRVEVDTLAYLGSETDSIWPSVIARAIRTRSGHYIVGGSDHPGSLAVYDSTGRLVQTWGRAGEGPGEFPSNYLIPILGPGDTVTILDILGVRQVVLDGLEHASTQALPARPHVAVHRGDRLILQAPIRGMTGTKHLLHSIRPAGTLEYSGAPQVVFRNEADDVLSIGPAANGGIWAAPRGEYRITHYDSSLQETSSLALDVEWFPPNIGMSLNPDEPPEPNVIGVWETPDGVLWVLLRIAASEWPPPPNPSRKMTVASVTAKYRWRLEALNPATGDRVGSIDFEELMSNGLGDGLLYSLQERDTGQVVIAVYRPRLVPR